MAVMPLHTSDRLSALERVPVALWLALAAVAVVALNPVGYLGGGSDDWQYLSAARCWAEHGPCLPHDHWTTRWPLIAPMAADVSVLGVTRTSVSLVPFAYAVAALVLFAAVADRLFGRGAALVGGLALLATPIFALEMLDPNVDVVELVFLLATLCAWLRGIDQDSRWWAVAAGVALSLAVQTRETSLVYGLIFAGWFLMAPWPHKRVLIWSALGFALPLMAELAVYAAAGDPLLRFSLALSHTTIVSAELAPDVDLTRSPLFNPDFIAGWVPSNGIDVHWTVRGVVNLLTHPMIGLTIMVAAALLLLSARRGWLTGTQARRARLAMLLPALGALLLIYGLAIDPKPRSFLPLLAGSAAVVGAVVAAAWAKRERMPALVAGIVASFGLATVALAPGIGPVEPLVAIWIDATPDTVTTDENSRRHFALVEQGDALPVDAPDRPLRIALVRGSCASDARTSEQIVREHDLASDVPDWLRWARPVADASGKGRALCLIRRAANPLALHG